MASPEHQDVARTQAVCLLLDELLDAEEDLLGAGGPPRGDERLGSSVSGLVQHCWRSDPHRRSDSQASPSPTHPGRCAPAAGAPGLGRRCRSERGPESF
jgi:hypothetical protein